MEEKMAREAHTTKSKRPRHSVDTTDPLARLAIRKASPHGGYGWIRDLPDERDFVYAAPLIRFPQGLPPSVDLRSECPPVYDQVQLGSFTGNGIAGAIEFDQRKQGTKEFTPSRLFIYYNERVIEGSVSSDAGAQIRDGIKSVVSQGVCDERTWGYEHAFDDVPWPHCYDQAEKGHVKQYLSLDPDLNQMQTCLAAGFPFIVGFTVYESFQSDAVASSGHVPMPGPDEQVIGGHAVLCLGYDN